MDHRQKGDAPNVIARPPRLYIAALVVGAGLGEIFPLRLVEAGSLANEIAGAAIAIAGIAVMALAMRRFAAAGTNVPTVLPATALVTDGIYRYSRNPIYVALTLIYAGLAVVLNSVWALMLLAPLMVAMRYGVIAREEDYLTRKFGADYLDYQRRVGRWF